MWASTVADVVNSARPNAAAPMLPTVSTRAWRAEKPLEGAIYAESIPFNETRDYVKKVLSNTTNYAALLTGQPQSLKERLGRVGPRDANAPPENLDLP